jgi:hypothetical protein
VYASRPSSWALLFVLAGGSGLACLSGPSPKDLLAVGFRTPEQTFATFQTALRADLVDLEYRSLSDHFKRTNRVSGLVYREARERLLAEQPFFKLAARAKILERVDLAPDRVRLTARVDAFFVERSFAVLLVREDYYETRDAEGLLEDDFVPWTSIAAQQGDLLRIGVPMPEGTTVDEIVELRAGREWKIDGFEALPTDSKPSS